PEPTELAKANRILRSLSELAQALIAAQPEEVPRRVMDAVFEHIRADRGFIMLREEGGSLEPRVVKYRNPAEAARITISITKADLELLSALANYAAVAIEQARLNEKIRDERFARERLEKYFSPSVVARILSEGEKEAQELEATILFADIVGFTRLAAKM